MIPIWRFGEPVAPLRALLARSGMLAIPTESSYGLAVDPRSAVGVEAIYRVKSRERGKPLPVVAADLAQLAELGVDLEGEAIHRACRVWPAAFSVVVSIAQPLPASAGERTLAVRVPDHAELRTLLAMVGTALTATSANLSGEPPLLDPVQVAGLLAAEDAIAIDGGVLPGGAPSTLVKWAGTNWSVLREGRFSPSDVPTNRQGTGLAERRQRGGETMAIYGNLSGKSGVNAYELGPDFIRVEFKSGAIYLYTYESSGPANVEHMKDLAEKGRGLASFISQHPDVREGYVRP
ncbi:MAG TPA: L-threonylcarbamoyladenylate synthase [Thermoanaerobaculia bacterium]|nr:L-threonylcarbamoyladenylate synthase [Thermoanaerobaculia bacterium]